MSGISQFSHRHSVKRHMSVAAIRDHRDGRANWYSNSIFAQTRLNRISVFFSEEEERERKGMAENRMPRINSRTETDDGIWNSILRDER